MVFRYRQLANPMTVQVVITINAVNPKTLNILDSSFFSERYDNQLNKHAAFCSLCLLYLLYWFIVHNLMNCQTLFQAKRRIN